MGRRKKRGAGMKDYYVYCIVDENGEIQKGTGSSQRTKFFEKPNQPHKWCEYNNEHHGKKWRTVKVKLVEVQE